MAVIGFWNLIGYIVHPGNSFIIQVAWFLFAAISIAFFLLAFIDSTIDNYTNND